MDEMKVQIKKRYRKTLLKGFDIKNAKHHFINKDERGIIYAIIIPWIPNNLCGVYGSDVGCGNCPFTKFKIISSNHAMGCLSWLETIESKIREENRHFRFEVTRHVIWYYDNDCDVVKGELEQIRKKASEYIEWV